MPEFRIIPRLEENRALAGFAATPVGKLALVTAFIVLLNLSGTAQCLELWAALAAISLFPRQRKTLVAAATFCWVLAYPQFGHGLRLLANHCGKPEILNCQLLLVLAFLLLSGLAVSFARARPEHPLMRRPVRNLLLAYTGLLMLASSLAPHTRHACLLWAFLLVSGKYLWFLAYSLTDRRSSGRPATLTQILSYQPFWGSTNTPFPKGEAYLARIEAKNEAELARTQLKGLKLLMWVLVLLAINKAFRFLAYGEALPFSAFSLPRYIPASADAVTHYLSGDPFPRWLCWMSVTANFCAFLLNLSIWGGIVVAICRMAGFNAFRNTYRPLSAVSIADFFNRVFYYFKELLVDLFFYPAYFRFFKRHNSLRIFFATLCAAGFGNMLFHFLRDIGYIVKHGFWEAIASFEVYIAYGLVLGTAIGLSQLRAMKNQPKPGVFNSASILLFYALISVPGYSPIDRVRSAADYGAFLLNLFIPFAR